MQEMGYKYKRSVGSEILNKIWTKDKHILMGSYLRNDNGSSNSHRKGCKMIMIVTKIVEKLS